MLAPQPQEPTHQKPLRLWPGIAIVVLQWLARYALPAILPGTLGFGVFAGLAGGLALLIWWAFLSRASRIDG